MRALVIDDARAMRLILRQALQKLGLEVIEAGNGREGLEQLQRGSPPDVVLVDCQMPEMDGFAFIKAVRAAPPWQHLQVVMVTAEEDPAQAARALEVGANAYLVKPFNKDMIRAKLDQLGITASLS
jgi:two-component system chemotaxis response regulator CheY